MLRTNGTRVLRRLSSTRTPIRTWTSVTTTREGLTVHSLNDTSFPYVWLRDSCQGPESVHPSNRQKLHRSSDIPLDIRPVELSEGEKIGPGQGTKGVSVTPEGIAIQWVDGRSSFFDRGFLSTHATPSALAKAHLVEYTSTTPWTLSTITETPSLFVSYESLQDPKGLVDAMAQLLKYGLVFVRGVPTDGKTNEECELKKLAWIFGEIRHTFYGELWDVINIANSNNIAYTNLDLGLHMDLLYLQHPPRFQALHCLRNRVNGGTSIFVDALQASHTLFYANRAHFDLLTRTPVAFQYVNDGHHLYMQHPTIQLKDARDVHSTEASTTPPIISHINYSPPFQGPLPLDTPREFFTALRHFSDILNDPKNTYSHTLKEGDCVLFDNRRVLHARTSFEEKTGADAVEGIPFGSGEAKTNRWLKGCYLEADAVADRMRVGIAKLGLQK